MDLVWTLLGVALIAIALRDIWRGRSATSPSSPPGDAAGGRLGFRLPPAAAAGLPLRLGARPRPALRLPRCPLRLPRQPHQPRLRRHLPGLGGAADPRTGGDDLRP